MDYSKLIKEKCFEILKKSGEEMITNEDLDDILDFVFDWIEQA
jgi:hypothetical protein